MIWRALADATVALHYAFLAYLLVGGFLAWRWRRTLPFHLAAAVWALLIVVVKVQCPLTWAQNWFRARDGLPPVHGGFIAGYVRGTLYPEGGEVIAQIVVSVVILVSWIGLVRRSGARSRAGSHA